VPCLRVAVGLPCAGIDAADILTAVFVCGTDLHAQPPVVWVWGIRLVDCDVHIF